MFSLGLPPLLSVDDYTRGRKLKKPNRCPFSVFSLINECTSLDRSARPDFVSIREQIEAIYMKQKKRLELPSLTVSVDIVWLHEIGAITKLWEE